MVADARVALWRWRLDVPAEQERAFRQILSPDERHKADRFATSRLRTRSVAARGGLRLALGRLLDVDPAALRFFYGLHGKPMLAEPDSSLQFNLSHAGGLAVLATSAGQAVGIDIERLGALPAELLDQLAPGEQARLAGVPAADRACAFFACWTRKEAFVKAVGLGLTMPFRGFDVLSDPGRVLIDGVLPSANDEGWRTISFRPAAGYVGALAARAGSIQAAAPVELFRD